MLPPSAATATAINAMSSRLQVTKNALTNVLRTMRSIGSAAITRAATMPPPNITMIRLRLGCSQVAATYAKAAVQTANVSQIPAFTIWDWSWLSDAWTILVDLVPSTTHESAKSRENCS